jgi:adenylate cyclase
MRRWHRSLIIGGLIGLLGVVFAIAPLYPWLEMRVGLYSLFHLRGPLPQPHEVAVVGIDSRTGQKLGLGDLPREWPRSIHAKLIDELTRRGAAVIVFDMDFRQPKDKSADEILSDAIQRSNRVVLFQHLNGRRQPIEDSAGREHGSVWVESLESPLPMFAQVARGLGPFPLPKLDAAVDQFWTFKSSARDAPTMPVVALQLYALPALKQIASLIATHLPQSSSFKIHDNLGNEELTQRMLELRVLLAKNPQLIEQLSVEPQSSSSPSEQASLKAALLQLYAGTNTRFLNFYGPPGAIATVPYQAVIQGDGTEANAQALDFANKVVFVGYSDLYDPGQPDRFYTVFTSSDGVDLSGVEIAATAFANLLHDESLTLPGSAQTLLLLFGFGAALGILIYLTPAAIGVPLSLAVTGLYIVAAQMIFNRSQLWLPLATPVLLQFPVALVAGLFGQYRMERQRARHISEAISLYVPAEVSSALSGNSVDANNINKVTFSTCLATDMAGFSTIAETMSAGDLAAFLNEYFEVLAQALKQHGVNITEFRADAIMCAWTGHVADPSVRRKPMLAALEANRAITRFNMQRGFGGNLRVGMADGEVFVGHAGGGGHFVYSIVGDCANTASRIEGLNKHLSTQILATGGVVANLGDFLTRRLGNFRFVGKTESLPIFEIFGLKDNCTQNDIERCDKFARGLQDFEVGDWKAAATHLEEILLEFSQDGPAKFLHNRCRMHLAGTDVPDNPAVIAMTAK